MSFRPPPDFGKVDSDKKNDERSQDDHPELAARRRVFGSAKAVEDCEWNRKQEEESYGVEGVQKEGLPTSLRKQQMKNQNKKR